MAAATVQELNQELREVTCELKRRDSENRELKLRLEKLEELMNPRHGGVK